ncbi:MAG: hypothetical protein AAF236_12800, partial [Verrucomicrobiota bacterium]
MKAIVSVFLALAILSPISAVSQVESRTSDIETFIEQLGVNDGESHLPGVGLAEGISQLTGVAISPLLGVSGIGAWTYFRTAPELRDELPWICHPIFWGIGMAVLGICFFKDSIGSILPAFLKKPLDLLEIFENKASALIASGAFVPFLVEQYSAHLSASTREAGATLAEQGFATAHLAFVEVGWFVTPLAIIGFLIVWMVSHTINVLILLSPFGLIDALLKILRTALIFSIALLYLVSPVLAAILSGIIIIVCALLAPAAFRLTLYGSLISWDLFRGIFWKSKLQPDQVKCFLARRGGNWLRARTLGKIRLTENQEIRFQSRLLFVGPTRRLSFPNEGRLVLVDGLLFPTIQSVNTQTDRRTTLIHLLPRFRHCS